MALAMRKYAPETNSPRHAYEYAPKTKSGERTDGPVTELAEKPELAGHSEGGGEERAPLLCAWSTLEPGSISLSVRALAEMGDVIWHSNEVC